MRKNQEENILPVLLIGLLFIAAVLFFNWRENKQESVIIELKTTSDAHEQRIKKLETETVVIEVEPAQEAEPPVRPKRVKVKPRVKKINDVNIATPNYPREPR